MFSTTLDNVREMPARRARTSVRYPAPARFDVHAVRAFEQWLANHPDEPVVVDLSATVFLDLHAIEALAAAAARCLASGTELVVAPLSEAAAITIEMVGGRKPELALAA